MRSKCNVWIVMFLFITALFFVGNKIDAKAATNVNWGVNYQNSISAGVDLREYQINLSSAGRINFTFENSMTYVWLSIYDSSGEKVWGSEDQKEGTTSYNIDFTKGTYTLKVEQYLNYTGFFSFRMNFTSANESFNESNNSRTIASRPSFGTRVNGQLADNDEIDYYRYDLSSAGRVSLTLNSAMPRVWIRMENAAGDIIWGSESPKEGSTQYNIDVTAGTYYISIEQYSSYTGNYNYTAAFSSAGESFAEPNDSPTNAAVPVFGSTVRGQIASNDDTDVYKYAFSSQKKIALRFNNNMERARIYLTDASGERVWGSESPKAGSTVYNIDVSAGTYYFYVEQYSNYTGTYSFVLGDYIQSQQSNSNKSTGSTATPKKTQIAEIRSKGGRKIVVSWKTKTGVSGYQIQCSLKRNFKKGVKTYTVKGASKSFKTIKKLKVKKKYFVRVRSFTKTNVNGKKKKIFSKWSKVKKVKVKK